MKIAAMPMSAVVFPFVLALITSIAAAFFVIVSFFCSVICFHLCIFVVLF